METLRERILRLHAAGALTDAQLYTALSKNLVEAGDVTVPKPATITNKENLTAQATAAFQTNRDAIVRNTASVAVANPTNAQVVAALKDALRQLSALEQQNNAIMRILLRVLDGTN